MSAPPKQVHRNIYTSKSRLKLFRGMYPPTSQLNTVYDQLCDDKSVVAGPHGSIAHGLKFEHHNPNIERFIEIYSMWGENDYIGNKLNPVCISSNAIEINQLLKDGAHLGFTGGGDCHEGHAGFSSSDDENQGVLPHAFAQLLRYRCGITAACIDNLNRKNLVCALRNRQAYATTGARILADFTLNGHSMGSIINEKTSSINIQCEVHLCLPGCSILVVKNGDTVYENKINKLDFNFTWQDNPDHGKENSYYIKIVQLDWQTLWTSPIWV